MPLVAKVLYSQYGPRDADTSLFCLLRITVVGASTSLWKRIIKWAGSQGPRRISRLLHIYIFYIYKLRLQNKQPVGRRDWRAETSIYPQIVRLQYPQGSRHVVGTLITAAFLAT